MIHRHAIAWAIALVATLLLSGCSLHHKRTPQSFTGTITAPGVMGVIAGDVISHRQKNNSDDSNSTPYHVTLSAFRIGP